MSYFNGDVVQQTYTGMAPTDFDAPATFVLSSPDPNVGEVISGWAYTLIHMVVGDFGLCIFLIKVRMVLVQVLIRTCSLIQH